MKPKFKDVFTPIIEYKDKVQIALEDGTLEIEDEHGEFLKIVRLLDGNKDIPQIASILECSEEDILEIVDDLNHHNLIEDANALNSTTLNNNELKRYRANLNYFSNFANLNTSKYEYQNKLKDATVLVLGLGGGSLIAASLAGMGVGKIIGLDYDTVELSNLNRQFLYSEDEIGKLKTTAAAERIKQINKEIVVEVVNMKVQNANCLSNLVEKSDIVINGIDQPAIISSRWVNFACVKKNKPFVQGGVGNKRILVQKFTPYIGGCFDCFLINSLRENSEFEYQLKSVYGESFEGRNTAFAPNVAMLTGMLTNEIGKLAANLTENNKESLTMEMDTLSYNIHSKKTWEKTEDCPTCGSIADDRLEPVNLDYLVNISKTYSGVN
ncbi:HesA/MoeB/ThiF family protein [Cytobacillus sp. Hm23]